MTVLSVHHHHKLYTCTVSAVLSFSVCGGCFRHSCEHCISFCVVSVYVMCRTCIGLRPQHFFLFMYYYFSAFPYTLKCMQPHHFKFSFLWVLMILEKELSWSCLLFVVHFLSVAAPTQLIHPMPLNESVLRFTINNFPQ